MSLKFLMASVLMILAMSLPLGVYPLFAREKSARLLIKQKPLEGLRWKMTDLEVRREGEQRWVLVEGSFRRQGWRLVIRGTKPVLSGQDFSVKISMEQSPGRQPVHLVAEGGNGEKETQTVWVEFRPRD